MTISLPSAGVQGSQMWLVTILYLVQLHILFSKGKLKEATLKEDQGKKKVLNPMKADFLFEASACSEPSCCTGHNHWPCRLILVGEAVMNQVRQKKSRQLANCVCVRAHVCVRGLAQARICALAIGFVTPRWMLISYKSHEMLWWKTERRNKSKEIAFLSSNREVNSLKITFKLFCNYF